MSSRSGRDIAPNAQLRHFDLGQRQYGHLTAFKQCSGRAARPFERQSMSALVKSRYFRKYAAAAIDHTVVMTSTDQITGLRQPDACDERGARLA
jgi:hypothetical protein